MAQMAVHLERMACIGTDGLDHLDGLGACVMP